MYLSDLRGPLVRRWYLCSWVSSPLQGFGLASAAAIPVTYQAKANVVFLPPKSAVGNNGNPYLALGGLDTAASVVAHAMSDSSTVRSLAESGVSGFIIEPDLAAGGPVLLVTADGATPRAALNSLAVLLERLPQVLDRLQTSVGTPTGSLITQEIITRDTAGAPVRKQLIRILLLAVAAGLGSTVVLAALIDGLILRPEHRATTAKTATTGPTPTPTPRPPPSHRPRSPPLPKPPLPKPREDHRSTTRQRIRLAPTDQTRTDSDNDDDEESLPRPSPQALNTRSARLVQARGRRSLGVRPPMVGVALGTRC